MRSSNRSASRSYGPRSWLSGLGRRRLSSAGKVSCSNGSASTPGGNWSGTWGARCTSNCGSRWPPDGATIRASCASLATRHEAVEAVTELRYTSRQTIEEDMATLTERIEADYKTAFKAREQRRGDTPRLLQGGGPRGGGGKNKKTLDDAEIIQVLNQQAKQRRETLEAAKQGGRQDILDQSAEELAILSAYLPQQLSTEALTQLVDEIG